MNFKIVISGDEGSLNINFVYPCQDKIHAEIKIRDIIRFGIVKWNEGAQQFVGYPAHRIDFVHAYEVKEE